MSSARLRGRWKTRPAEPLPRAKLPPSLQDHTHGIPLWSFILLFPPPPPPNKKKEKCLKHPKHIGMGRNSQDAMLSGALQPALRELTSPGSHKPTKGVYENNRGPLV